MIEIASLPSCFILQEFLVFWKLMFCLFCLGLEVIYFPSPFWLFDKNQVFKNILSISNGGLNCKQSSKIVHILKNVTDIFFRQRWIILKNAKTFFLLCPSLTSLPHAQHTHTFLVNWNPGKMSIEWEQKLANTNQPVGHICPTNFYVAYELRMNA